MFCRSTRAAVLAPVLALVAILAAVLVGRPGAAHADTAPPGTPDPATMPVILVHGFSGTDCPGGDVAKGTWAGVKGLIDATGRTGPVLPVSYYACDANGVDITGYGPDVPAGATPTITAAHPRVAYTGDTSMVQLAHDLAWFIHDTYTQAGTPVSVVAISMGGLLARIALEHVQHGDAAFPPTLDVRQVITLSTPHAGVGTAAQPADGCNGKLECREFATDSPLIADLQSNAADPQGVAGTHWTAIGSSAGCDLVPAPSALALPAAEKIDYGWPCYTHTGYLWDGVTSTDARADIRQGWGPTTSTVSARHVDPFVVDRLLNPLPVSLSADAVPADVTPPTVTVAALDRFARSDQVTLRWSATDASAIASYDVRLRTTLWNSTNGPATTYPAQWQGLTSPSLTWSAPAGAQFCFAVRARDVAGNLSYFGPDTCTAMPVDDRTLTRSPTGWATSPSGSSYRATITQSTQAGATMTAPNTYGKQVAVVVATCPTCGPLGIYLDGALWQYLDTRSSSIGYRTVLVQPAYLLKTRQVVLKAMTAAPVIIDGFAVAQS